MYNGSNTIQIYIPGGCAKYSQALDAIIMNSFKRKCERYKIDEEIVQVEKSAHRKGNIQPINRQKLIKSSLMIGEI